MHIKYETFSTFILLKKNIARNLVDIHYVECVINTHKKTKKKTCLEFSDLLARSVAQDQTAEYLRNPFKAFMIIFGVTVVQ